MNWKKMSLQVVYKTIRLLFIFFPVSCTIFATNASITVFSCMETEEEEQRDAVLVTDGDSEIGQVKRLTFNWLHYEI